VKNKLVVIAGPTASGKSALALAVAEEFGGMVINADSMQIYHTLRILTARPTPADEARVPHRLYGILSPTDLCSAGRWRSLAAAACDEAWSAGKLPVVVGGTGLYLRALLGGLSPIPDIPDDIRAATRARFAHLGNAAFHAGLAAVDPVMAARLHPANSQRLIRAWEVLAATGRSLADWQAQPPFTGLDAAAFTISVTPPRQLLYAGCDRRFLDMLERGAVDEVRALMALDLAHDLPAMRALGVPALIAYVKGEINRDEAVEEAQQATRNYAKRQLTWFRHQLSAQYVLDAQFSESLSGKIFSIIRLFLLTDAL
jgi:tRNA dimethylallyltransferase